MLPDLLYHKQMVCLKIALKCSGLHIPNSECTTLPQKKAEGGNLQLRWRNISPADVQGFIPSVDTLKVVAQKG